jgi:DNA-binding Lrp family transcriptional regulator
MAQAFASIGSMIFRPASLENTDAFSLDGRMLAIFIEFDGSRTVAEIADRVNVEPPAITRIVRRLSELGLIEPVTGIAQPLALDVLEQVTRQLALAVGPVAVVLVEDEILDLGYKPDSFPLLRLEELIDRLSGHIRKEDKKQAFLSATAELIRRKR